MGTISKKLLLGSIMAMPYADAIAQDSTVVKSDSTKKLKEVTVKFRRASTQISMLDPMKRELISQRELLKAACCNLSESFETTPSVDVAFTDAVSGYKQIQMLGLAGPYTLITRENIPDTRGLAAVTGLTFTPGTFIEGMQLSKGTGSVVNGYESVAGQINVEWRKPFEDKEEKLHLNLYQSSQGRTEGNIVYRNKLSDKLSTNILLHGKSQWLKLDNNNDGFLDQPLDKQFVGANRWFWFGPKGWEVQGGVKAAFVQNTGGQWNYERNGEQITGKPWGFQLNTERVEGWAKIGKMFSKPGTSMGLQLAGVYHNQDAKYGSTNYLGTQRSFYANLIYQTILGNTNHILKGGLSTLVDNYDETFRLTNYKRNEIVPGAFAEYAYTHSTKFNLVAGIRGDYHNIFGVFATPRLHVRYAPFKKTVLRASVGRAQRTANIFAENMGYMASNRSFMVQSAAGSANPYGLNPEVAWNSGVNLTQKFVLDYRDGAVSVDYYYTHFQNQVVVDVEDAHSVQFYNLNGLSFANSLQAQADYELIHNLDLRLAYRWYDVRTSYGNTLKERPLVAAHRAFANIGYETRNKWKFDYTVQWIGSKRIPSLHSHHGGGVTSESYSPSFWQMNAQISKSWNDKLEVYLGGENLTNYMMHDPIVGAGNPYNVGFDASMIWGPIMGANIYGGFRYKLR
ncbi:MAG: TonB-dependent receptor [Chitinophagales bacterium]|nr:TonB-dependent receptor [Chitinophagales bacterium]